MPDLVTGMLGTRWHVALQPGLLTRGPMTIEAMAANGQGDHPLVVHAKVLGFRYEQPGQVELVLPVRAATRQVASG